MDTRLVQMARRQLRDDALPRTLVFRTWGGPGSGQPCALCRQPIDASMNEIEVVWNAAGATSSVVMHVECKGAWLLASREACTERRSDHEGA